METQVKHRFDAEACYSAKRDFDAKAKSDQMRRLEIDSLNEKQLYFRIKKELDGRNWLIEGLDFDKLKKEISKSAIYASTYVDLLKALANGLSIRNDKATEGAVKALVGYMISLQEGNIDKTEDELKCEQRKVQEDLELEQIRFEAAQEKAGIPKVYRFAKLEDNLVNDLQILRKFITSDDGKPLVIQGDTGTGKSYSAISVLNYEISRGNLNVKFLGIHDVDLALNNQDFVYREVGKMKNYSMLVINDVGFTTLSEKKLDIFCSIIDSRRSNKLKTILIFHPNIVSTAKSYEKAFKFAFSDAYILSKTGWKD